MQQRFGVDVQIDIKGLKELRKLLTPPDNLFIEAWRDGMDDIARSALSHARRGAPRGATGKLSNSVRVVVSKRRFPDKVTVYVNARSSRAKRLKWPGYPYPKKLNYDKRLPTYLWLDRSISPVWNSVEGILTKIGNGVANKWKRG